jgi:Icc-related predicted phosphoesterase
VDLHVHGHAHLGSEQGMTPGGVPVRNVALPVIKRPYAVYSLAGNVLTRGKTFRKPLFGLAFRFRRRFSEC